MAPSGRDASRRSGVAVTLDAAAHTRLVAKVGPLPAAAFVAVALRASRERRGRLVAATSARSMAAELGVAKDTAAGVLSRLVDAGYLRRQNQPRSAGRFAPASYVVRPPAGFSVTCPEGAPRPPTADTTSVPTRRRSVTSGEERADGPQARRRTRGDRGGDDQLGLFAASGEGDTGTTR